MIEAALATAAAATPAITSFIETSAMPVLGAWLASELMGVSKKTKYNGIFHLAFGLVKAVGKELAKKDTQQPQSALPQVSQVQSALNQIDQAQSKPDNSSNKPANDKAEPNQINQAQSVLEKVAEAQSTLEQVASVVKTLQPNTTPTKTTATPKRRRTVKKTSTAKENTSDVSNAPAKAPRRRTAARSKAR